MIREEVKEGFTNYENIYFVLLMKSAYMTVSSSFHRYKCSECIDYDLCYECIKMANLIHNIEHNFLEFLNPVEQNEPPRDTSVINYVTVFPILPTKKEDMLNLLQEEEKRRFSPELQQKYYEVGSDPTSGKDWMDVTDQMQHELVREFGYSDEAVELLRRAPQLYKGKKGIVLFFFCYYQAAPKNPPLQR